MLGNMTRVFDDRKDVRQNRIDGFVSNTDVQKGPDEILSDKQFKEALLKLFNKHIKNKKINEVMKCRYFNGYNLLDTCSILDLPHTSVVLLEAKGLRLLRHPVAVKDFDKIL